MTNATIRGKVARILNSRELVITAGSEQGVAIGMLFDILDPKGQEITDPDTGEVLGSIERPKIRVQVIKVYDRLSVASTFRKTEVNVGGLGANLDIQSIGIYKLFMPPRYITINETLKTNENTWEDVAESENYIAIGDPVSQVDTEITI